METISWYKQPRRTDEGYEITHHMYSDTSRLDLDGSTLVDEQASMNSQGDMSIWWVEDKGKGARLWSSHHSTRDGEYGSHEYFKKLAERLSGLKFEDMLRR